MLLTCIVLCKAPGHISNSHCPLLQAHPEGLVNLAAGRRVPYITGIGGGARWFPTTGAELESNDVREV